MFRQNGTTLVELVIALVIVGIGVVGILKVMELTTRHSADPMVEQQAIVIAEAYLEEVLTKAYDDPESEAGSCEEGPPPAARALYDDVNDYGCISGALSDIGAHDQFGNAVAGLGAYTISVAVSDVVMDTAVAAKRIEVRVVHTSGIDIELSGYRTNH